MLKAGIIGCGQIAEAHVEEIRKTKLASVECVCDREPVMAEQFAKRYAVPRSYTDLHRMLEEERLDVVHIATPPRSHYNIAITAIDRGCHVVVEKPVTMNFSDTSALIRYAAKKGKLLTAGYTYYFDPPAERLRDLVVQGRLGSPVHIESYYGYSMSGPFGTAIMSDPNHWVHKLPGKLFHNNIDHLIYRFIEYVPVNENSDVSVVSYRREMGISFNDARDTLMDELRINVFNGGTTVFAMFSSNVKPASQSLRLYGTRATASVDYISRSVIIDEGVSIPTALGRALIPFKFARSQFAAGVANLSAFRRNKFQYFAGFRKLFEKFYTAIKLDGPSPIPYDHLLSTAYLVDVVNKHLSERGGE